MQVSAAQSSPWSPFARQPAPGQTDTAHTAPTAAIELPAPLEEDVVSVHPAGEVVAQAKTAQAARTLHPPEVFAEIWKDGMRVGTIYTDGEAALAGGIDASPLGARGAMYARMHAEELSRRVGGEVRYVNLDALRIAQNREQLRAAYGA